MNKDYIDEFGFQHVFDDDPDIGLQEIIIYNNVTYSSDEPLTDFAFDGRCVIYSGKPDMFFSNGTYISPILTNPTNADIFKIANDYVIATCEQSHFFYEGLHVKGKMINSDVYEVDLIMGS